MEEEGGAVLSGWAHILDFHTPADVLLAGYWTQYQGGGSHDTLTRSLITTLGKKSAYTTSKPHPDTNDTSHLMKDVDSHVRPTVQQWPNSMPEEEVPLRGKVEANCRCLRGFVSFARGLNGQPSDDGPTPSPSGQGSAAGQGEDAREGLEEGKAGVAKAERRRRDARERVKRMQVERYY